MRTMLVTGFAGLFSAIATLAEPPSDTEVFNCIRSIQMRYAELERDDFRAAKQQFRQLIAEGARALELNELTPYQAVLVGPLFDRAALDDDQEAALSESLERAAADRESGAAALLLLNAMHWDEPANVYLARFFEHPGMKMAMNGCFTVKAINAFNLEPDELRRFGADVERSILAINPHNLHEAPNRPAVTRLLEAFDHPEIAEEMKDRRRRIHEHLLTVARAILSKYAPAGGRSVGVEEYRMMQAIDLVEYLEGPASRSELIGEPAPELTFRWSRGPDAPVKSLADLKGKVVVLDFWATWCAPCVATFPDVRELQAHYADCDDVVIVGVTSIQGYHVPESGQIVSVEDDPEREMTLMEEYMEAKEITWNIAYSTREVADPRFDVWGIPHLTIIDRQGRVRHNGLHPGNMPFEEKTRIIDVLFDEEK